MNIIEMLVYDEGETTKPYYCTGGYLTNGCGLNLEVLEMPKEVADLWLDYVLKDIDKKIVYYPLLNSAYIICSEVRKMALKNMMYQMGVSGASKFKNMLTAIIEGDFEKAADEALDSKWAEQTPNRAKRISHTIRTDKLEAYK